MDAVSAVGDGGGSRGPHGHLLRREAENRAVAGTNGLRIGGVADDRHGRTCWLHDLAAGSHAKGGVECHCDIDFRRSFKNDDSQHQRELVRRARVGATPTQSVRAPIHLL